MCYVCFSFGLEGDVVGVLSGLVEVFSCVYDDDTLATLGIIGDEQFKLVIGVLPHKVEDAAFEWELRHEDRFLLFIFNIVLNC